MANFRTAMTAMAVAAALMGSQALAADVSPLAPGKPAGVREAQRSPSLLLIGGAAVVVVVGIVIATQNSNNAVCGPACVTPATST